MSDQDKSESVTEARDGAVDTMRLLGKMTAAELNSAIAAWLQYYSAPEKLRSGPQGRMGQVFVSLLDEQERRAIYSITDADRRIVLGIRA